MSQFGGYWCGPNIAAFATWRSPAGQTWWEVQELETEPRMVACNGACCFAIYLTTNGEERGIEAIKEHPECTNEAARMIEIFEVVPEWSGIAAYHRCRVFDGKQCTEYEQRPTLCSAYPYSHECEFCDGGVMRDVSEVLRRSPGARQNMLETGCFDPATYDLIVTYFAA